MTKQLFFLFIFMPLACFAQVNDNFSDDDFTQNPAWNGSVDVFEVLDGMLHLNDKEVASGNSNNYLSTPSAAAVNASWEIFVKFDYQTNELSTGNYCCIYLMSDVENVKNATAGYYVKVGGNGSGDAGKRISLYKVGNSTAIISGVAERLKFHPTTVKIKVTRDENSLWTLFSDIFDGNGYLTEGTVQDNSRISSNYFGIYCYYSATRKTAFYFDNIVVSGEKELENNAQTPENGDLVWNEVMFNNSPASVEYVEIVNRSDKRLHLSGLTFSTLKTDGTANTAVPIPAETFIEPHSYAAFCSDAEMLYDYFDLQHDKAKIFTVARWNTLNNEGATLVLTNSDGAILDQFAYSAKWHHPLIKNVQGVALEKINPQLETQDVNAWHSAASEVNYGTPGYRNSQFRDVENDDLKTKIWLETEVFSPDNDGVNDVCFIRYSTEIEGYTATCEIFNAVGEKVANVCQNQILSSEGILTWNGTNEAGKLVNAGIYALYFQFFNPNTGKKQVIKLPIVVYLK